jgi:hypothetical protein
MPTTRISATFLGMGLVVLCLALSDRNPVLAQQGHPNSPIKACVSAVDKATANTPLGTIKPEDPVVHIGKFAFSGTWTIDWHCTGVASDPTQCKVCLYSSCRVSIDGGITFGPFNARSIDTGPFKACGSTESGVVTEYYDNLTPNLYYRFTFYYAAYNPAGGDCLTGQLLTQVGTQDFQAE